MQGHQITMPPQGFRSSTGKVNGKIRSRYGSDLFRGFFAILSPTRVNGCEVIRSIWENFPDWRAVNQGRPC
jgi:hypothetical protein